MLAISRLLQTLTFTLGLFGAGLSTAAPVVTYSGGVATGIQDLVVGTTTYDVSFVFGSYNTVFASDAPTFLGDLAGANAAADALKALLDPLPAVTIGSGTGCCGLLWVPYQATATHYEATQTGYGDAIGASWQRYGNFSDSRTADRTSANWSFAVLTLNQNTVPEPGSLALVLMGLAVAAALKRKRQAA